MSAAGYGAHGSERRERAARAIKRTDERSGQALHAISVQSASDVILRTTERHLGVESCDVIVERDANVCKREKE